MTFASARSAAASRSCLRAAYVESVRDVVSALSDTILFEASGASEREVRRKADPAKASIERFLRDWKGSPLVSSQPSYAALVGAFRLSSKCSRCRKPFFLLCSDAYVCFADALRQLGAFYAARGSRAALTPDVRDAVLAALKQADADLLHRCEDSCCAAV